MGKECGGESVLSKTALEGGGSSSPGRTCSPRRRARRRRDATARRSQRVGTGGGRTPAAARDAAAPLHPEQTGLLHHRVWASEVACEKSSDRGPDCTPLMMGDLKCTPPLTTGVRGCRSRGMQKCGRVENRCASGLFFPELLSFPRTHIPPSLARPTMAAVLVCYGALTALLPVWTMKPFRALSDLGSQDLSPFEAGVTSRRWLAENIVALVYAASVAWALVAGGLLGRESPAFEGWPLWLVAAWTVASVRQAGRKRRGSRRREPSTPLTAPVPPLFPPRRFTRPSPPGPLATSPSPRPSSRAPSCPSFAVPAPCGTACASP
jgi:hypothetical protein